MGFGFLCADFAFGSLMEGHYRGWPALLAFFSCLVMWIIVPVLMPISLSRKGYLSVGRWSIMAAVSGCVAILGFPITELEMRQDFPDYLIVALGLNCLVPGSIGVIGCLLAAAFHPKGM